MKAQDRNFTEFLEGSKQFVIPIFQRTYSWDEKNCQQLWDDIVRVGSNPELTSHFVGSVVYIPETDVNAAIPSWLVIDGQQRITTLSILMLAIRNRLAEEDSDEPVSCEQVEDLYLKNRYGKGEAAYRLLLTKTDKEWLCELVDRKVPDEENTERVVENFRFYEEKIEKADLSTVWKGIKKLMIVDVHLQQGLDNPQMIFESMNSTGKTLTQADLIRNFVLMGLPHDEQTRLYNEYWRPMEVEFGAQSYIDQFDEFMRYFLVIHTGNHRTKKAEVYEEFKAYSRKLDTESILSQLREFSGYFCRIALGHEPDPDLKQVFHDIRELRADVAYPMLMELLKDHREERIGKNELIESLRMVENYVFRRVVCDIPTNSLRQTFATFMPKVKKDRYLESVKASFLLLRSYRRFPSDEEFSQKIQERNLYKFNRRNYWLRRFENHGRKERVPVQEYTIEHILPQNEDLSPEWREALGENWRAIQEKYLHTLGNLTLTGYNSEYSDRPFQKKRDIEGGFKQSPLKLNQELGGVVVWNEDAIQARAQRLSKEAIKVWKAPVLDADILEAYQPKSDPGSEYSVKDHPQLLSGLTQELYQAFRERILALDECVREEFLKLYVAFKAETNFVDIIPQSKQLRLIFNIDFPSIDDPREVCRDITGMGKWGNGDVEMVLKESADVPYAVGIARQALENQLGEE